MAKKTELEKAYAIWNKKLEASGFVDVERKKKYMRQFVPAQNIKTIGDEFSRSEPQNQYNKTWQDSKQEFYRLATFFLNDYAFKSDLDKKIWTYYQDGIGTYKIATLLKEEGIKNFGSTMVGRTIARLTEEMKIMYGVK